jgi:hypothetical protein
VYYIFTFLYFSWQYTCLIIPGKPQVNGNFIFAKRTIFEEETRPLCKANIGLMFALQKVLCVSADGFFSKVLDKGWAIGFDFGEESAETSNLAHPPFLPMATEDPSGGDEGART